MCRKQNIGKTLEFKFIRLKVLGEKFDVWY